MTKSHFLTHLKLLLTAFFWGGTFIAGRLLAQDMDPYSAAFLRFFIATTLLVIITWKIEGKLPGLRKHHILPLILLGLTGVFAYNVFFFKGLYYVNAGRAALIIATNPIFISILSFYIFKERLSTIKVFGILLSVTGAIIVIVKGHPDSVSVDPIGLGEIFIFICVASWVTYSLIGKKVMADLSPLVSVCYSSAIGTIALFFPAFFHGVFNKITTFSPLNWISLFYLAFFGTVLGFLWYYEGIQKIGATKAGIYINFVPVSSLFLAFFLLDEPVTFSLIVGMIFVGCGVYFTNANFKNKIF